MLVVEGFLDKYIEEQHEDVVQEDFFFHHRIIAWFGLEGTLKIIWFQPRLLRAPSNLALNPAREGAATASLGNLGQGFTTLMRKNFFLISHLNLPSFRLELFPLVLLLHIVQELRRSLTGGWYSCYIDCIKPYFT